MNISEEYRFQQRYSVEENVECDRHDDLLYL